MRAAGVGRSFAVSLRDGRVRGEVEPVHRGTRGERGAHVVARLLAQRDRAAHRALGANVTRELARVDVRDDRHPRLRQPVGERARRSPVGRLERQLAHHHTGHARPVGFDVLGIDAVVADHRGRHHHDLPEIRRVGEDLLVARQVRGEDDFGVRPLERDGRRSGEPGAVFEQHVGWGGLSDQEVSGRTTDWTAAGPVAAPAAWIAAAAAWAAPEPAAGRSCRSPSAGRWSART